MKLWLRALSLLNDHGKCFAIKLRGIHPKHLVEVPERRWYLDLIKSTDCVLDVGCGTGANVELAAERCPRGYVTGIDRHEFIPESLNVSSVAMDITKHRLPGLDMGYDVVLFFDVIEHLTEIDREWVLGEIRRVLKPDGLLIVSAPNRETSWRRRLRAAGLFSYSDPDHKIEYSRAEFVQELTVAGFEVGRVAPIVYDTPWAGLIDLIGGFWLRPYRWLSIWRHRAAHLWPEESIGFITVARPR